MFLKIRSTVNLPVLLAVPVIGILLLLQTGVFSWIFLLHGTVDLILLTLIAWSLQKRVESAWIWTLIAGIMVGYTSAIPFGVHLIGYGLVTGLALALRRRIWEVPVMAMLLTTLVGTIITKAVSLVTLTLIGIPLPIDDALNLVILPSIFLNLILSIPFYAFAGDLARMLYPERLEV